jgi:hypothetical protein
VWRQREGLASSWHRAGGRFACLLRCVRFLTSLKDCSAFKLKNEGCSTQSNICHFCNKYLFYTIDDYNASFSKPSQKAACSMFLVLQTIPLDLGQYSFLDRSLATTPISASLQSAGTAVPKPTMPTLEFGCGNCCCDAGLLMWSVQSDRWASGTEPLARC